MLIRLEPLAYLVISQVRKSQKRNLAPCDQFHRVKAEEASGLGCQQYIKEKSFALYGICNMY